MNKKFHTVVIGGGCLGAASAISLARHLKKTGGKPDSVCLIEKNVLGSALSIRHSGIVRSANADNIAAKLGQISTDMWLNLKDIWGVEIELEKFGAIWIAKKDKNSTNEKWDQLAKDLKSIPINFKKISQDAANKICPEFVNLYDDEVFYHEPEAIQLDPAYVRKGLYEGITQSEVALFEKEEVLRFKKNSNENITEIVTTNYVIKADYVINAVGPWSANLFAKAGISIPVSVEPVYVVNWLSSLSAKKVSMPIIADYVNRAYFRSWRDGEIHMHQPRKRAVHETSTTFADNPLSVIGADFINDPTNQIQNYSQIKLYEEIAHKRFKNLNNTVFSSGYRSYFDITPDLKFILGPDTKIKNLIHCLGSGQAFKFAPVFGEMMVQYVLKRGLLSKLGDAFSINRFDAKYMKNFWSKVNGNEYSLYRENSSL